MYPWSAGMWIDTKWAFFSHYTPAQEIKQLLTEGSGTTQCFILWHIQVHMYSMTDFDCSSVYTRRWWCPNFRAIFAGDCLICILIEKFVSVTCERVLNRPFAGLEESVSIVLDLDMHGVLFLWHNKCSLIRSFYTWSLSFLGGVKRFVEVSIIK